MGVDFLWGLIFVGLALCGVLLLLGLICVGLNFHWVGLLGGELLRG